MNAGRAGGLIAFGEGLIGFSYQYDRITRLTPAGTAGAAQSARGRQRAAVVVGSKAVAISQMQPSKPMFAGAGEKVPEAYPALISAA
jgi:hypothetical protein